MKRTQFRQKFDSDGNLLEHEETIAPKQDDPFNDTLRAVFTCCVALMLVTVTAVVCVNFFKVATSSPSTEQVR